MDFPRITFFTFETPRRDIYFFDKLKPQKLHTTLKRGAVNSFSHIKTAG